jgi:hypothetical protein
MSVKILLTAAAAVLAAVAGLIALIGLVHELASAKDAHMLVHGLETWVTTVGFHLALILLAAALVNYLAYKK